MAGQGTMALELLEDVPDLDVIIAPVSGGGMVRLFYSIDDTNSVAIRHMCGCQGYTALCSYYRRRARRR